jgi:hypothetical protein
MFKGLACKSESELIALLLLARQRLGEIRIQVLGLQRKEWMPNLRMQAVIHNYCDWRKKLYIGFKY